MIQDLLYVILMLGCLFFCLGLGNFLDQVSP